MTLTLTIRLSTSARFTLPSSDAGESITPSTTVLEIKRLISTRDEAGCVEVSRQRLIYKGRILSENDKSLAHYGIEGGQEQEPPVLYLVKGSAASGGGGTGGANATGATSSAVPPVSSTNTNNINNINNNTNNPFAMFGMNNNATLGGGAMPDLQQMQQQLQSNPELMSQMMNNPTVQSLMSDPSFLSNMMESNPQMQQVLNSNPELRNALRDPEMMRRSMEMMRNPGMMDQMMRNQDLAMANIENMPGGYNALRRMYEDVQVPMMDAMDGNGNAAGGGNAGGGNTANNNSGARNQAMPNPWGSSSSSSSGTAANLNPASANNNNTMFNPFANMPNFGNPNNANPWMSAMNNPGAAGAAAGSTQQLEATIQMLENPMMQQMMNQMMSNPEAVRGMMESNPMMRQMRDSNPQVAAMMDNPEMVSVTWS